MDTALEGPWTAARADAEVLADRLGPADAALVLGSGWAAVAPALGDVDARMPMADLSGVPRPTVAGHGSEVLAVRVGPTRVLALAGRSHLYEGHPPATVVHAVRAAVLAGCRCVVLTNAAGSLRPDVGVGRAVVIRDHLNLTGSNPMVGAPPPPELGSRFVDLTDLYSPRLRAVAREAGHGTPEGVYAGLLGASFETPAEIRMLAGLGADLVGMSTVLEAIAARHLGAEVFGVSLVTNLAAGLQSGIDHAEVLAAGAAATGGLTDLLRAVLAAV